jgi:hypothetical protein
METIEKTFIDVEFAPVGGCGGEDRKTSELKLSASLSAGSVGPKSARNFRKGLTLESLIKLSLPVADLLLAPFVYPAALLLKMIRIAGVHRMPLSRQAMLQVGVFPVRNHYFEPLFDGRNLRIPLEQDRSLPGIAWNVAAQLDLLKSFSCRAELETISAAAAGERSFDPDNAAFGAGDAEFLYNLIRLKKPARIFEIGSGHSTLLAMEAVRENKKENPGYSCKHLCIEPFEQPWLEETGVVVVRRRVEELGVALFSELEKDDLLFIDSSHVIRPQGDVLFEYLELLPTLKAGVIVHIHDIFSPRDYPKAWVRDEVRLWNEQYLLEAFLTGNTQWKVLAALNHLHHNNFAQLSATSPYLTRDCEPGSFYIQKIA